ELRLCVDELLHQANALVVLHYLDRDPVGAHVLLGAEEGPIFANHHARDLVKDDSAAAHRARRERRVNRAGLVDARGQPAGVAQAVHLAVIDRAAGLYAAVMAAPDNAAFVHQDGADGNAAFGKALARLLDGGVEKRVAGHLAIVARRPAGV